MVGAVSKIARYTESMYFYFGWDSFGVGAQDGKYYPTYLGT